MAAKHSLLFRVLTCLFLLQTQASFAAVELSLEEMTRVVGGVTITNFVAPPDGTLVGLDNPVITADFISIRVPEIKLEARVNGSKIAFEILTTTPIPGSDLNSGRFSAPAFDFPIGQTTDVAITVNDGNVPDGDRITTGVRINPVIDVPVIMVHRLVDNFGGPSVPNALPLAFFDFPALEPLPLTDVLGLDAILAQCTTAARIQIRAVPSVSTVSVPADCSRPNFITQPPLPPTITTCRAPLFPVPGSPQLGPGVVSFYDNLVNTLPPGFFHVFIVDSVRVNGVPIGGATFTGNNGPERRYSLVTNQTVGFLQVFGRSILHEYLHTRRLGHPDQPPQSQPQSIVDPLANNCGVGGGGQAGENVMCASAAVQPDPFDMVPTAGLTVSQCLASKANPNQATNFN